MSRQAAFDFIIPRIQPGARVLDIGAGDSPFTPKLLEAGCSVTAVDHNEATLHAGWERAGRKFDIACGDIRTMNFPPASFDVVMAVYSIMCMIPFEPLVWVMIRQWLKEGGDFLGMARLYEDSPKYEGCRGDPLISQDENTLRVLAGFTNFAVLETQRYWYLGNVTNKVDDGEKANAIGFHLKAVSVSNCTHR